MYPRTRPLIGRKYIASELEALVLKYLCCLYAKMKVGQRQTFCSLAVPGQSVLLTITDMVLFIYKRVDICI